MQTVSIGLRRARVALAATGLLGVACAQAAAVLFDIPEPAPTAPADTVRPAAVIAVVDTPPTPPIELLRDRDSILALLPTKPDGGIDWNGALRARVVAPRKAAPSAPDPGYLESFGYDVYLKGPNPSLDALFSHSAHGAWLACTSCHPTQVRYGRAAGDSARSDHTTCGICHKTAAFPMGACSRCHTGVSMGSAKASLADDLVLARTDSGGALPQSRFNHSIHRIQYRCSACHSELFQMRAGADTLTMAALREGKACGACHDNSAAFGMGDCMRCHTAPR